MATNALHAQGTLIQRGDGASPEAFTTIAEVLSISGPSLKSDQIEVTHQSSTGKYREYIQGLRDGGEITFDLNYNPNEATHNVATGILGDFTNGTRRNYRIRFPSTPTVDWIARCTVQDASVNAEVDSQLKLNITLKVVEAPTLV